jgi:hypothetical protein
MKPPWQEVESTSLQDAMQVQCLCHRICDSILLTTECSVHTKHHHAPPFTTIQIHSNPFTIIHHHSPPFTTSAPLVSPPSTRFAQSHKEPQLSPAQQQGQRSPESNHATSRLFCFFLPLCFFARAAPG